MENYQEVRKEILNKDKQTKSRLVGICLFVYSFLCLSTSVVGSYLSIPFTMLFGFLSPFVLTYLLFLSVYRIFFLKRFSFFSFKENAFLLLTVIFTCGIISFNVPVTINNFAKSYFDTYHFSYRLFYFSGVDNILSLKGGLFGYFLTGLINIITHSKVVITLILLCLLTSVCLFMFVFKYAKKFICYLGRLSKTKDKKEVLKMKLKLGKFKNEKNSKIISELDHLLVEDDEEIFDLNSKNDEVNISNKNANSINNNGSMVDEKSKLSSMLGVFDEEIYDEGIKGSQVNEEVEEIDNGLVISSKVKMDGVNYDDSAISKTDVPTFFKDEPIRDTTASFINTTSVGVFDTSIPKNENFGIELDESDFEQETQTSPITTQTFLVSDELEQEESKPTTIQTSYEIKNDNLYQDDFNSPDDNEIMTFSSKKEEVNEKETNTYSYNDEVIYEDIKNDLEKDFENHKKEENDSSNIINENRRTYDADNSVKFVNSQQSSFSIYDGSENIKEEDIHIDESNYQLPPTSLLLDSIDDGASIKNEEIAKDKASVLQEKLDELKVGATVNAYVVGPSVTRFEVSLAPGVRVNTIVNLIEDFKLALGASQIRIESPIPGKSAIGLEVPNVYRSAVSLKEIISNMPFKRNKIFVPVGKDITGEPISIALNDMPHCLISGSSNSGKSVCANALITSLIMKYKPSEVRLLMVDPKSVELSSYNDIPHQICPIVTEFDHVIVALEKMINEMNKRYQILQKASCRNIASYNDLMVEEGKPIMPFIFVVIDEFAELMLSRIGKALENSIQSLAQKGRAAGIHLILIAQRPDVNVMAGNIKANLSCRLTFRLASIADSRTVIDISGAEKLLNNGDMLLLTPDYSGLRRVQGVFVTDQEIDDVVDFVKNQACTHYDSNFLDLRSKEEIEEEERLKYASDDNNENDEYNDPIYLKVKDVVIKDRHASVSYLRRKFGFGYSKAARYLDMLEDEGIVGPDNGAKPRDLLVDENGNPL